MTSIARYRRRPPSEASTSCEYLMPESTPSNPRKRQRSEPAQLEKTSQPAPKKQRLDRHSRSQTPAAYWDNASKVWLTKRALKELDRRTRQARPTPRPARQHTRRQVTRNSVAESKRSHRTAQYTADPLSSYESRTAKKIKLSARQGGPDLSELRNVRIAEYLLM